MEQKKPKEKKTPVRQCAGCSEHLPKKEMLRVVRTPEGEVALDLTGKRSGRGVYLCRKASCFKKARKTRRLERELECGISEELYDSIEAEIAAAERGEGC